MSITALVVGVVLVAVVLFDLFRTVLLPRPAPRTLRISPVVGAAIAPPWLRAARRLRSPERRQRFRGSLGPTLIVLTIIVWMAVLFIGFGLMLFGLSDELSPAITFGDGIYYAASAFLTLGISPAEANGAARIVVVAAGLVGLAVVTLLVTFVLSMQNELTRREVLVLRTQLSAGEPPTGLALLNTHAGAGMTARLADIFRDWETWAADVLHSHRANPILIQFRSADEAGEWLAVFGAVMDAAVLLLGAVEREGLEPAISAARLFMAMGTRTLIELNALRRLDPVRDFADEQAMAQDIQRARRRLAMAGYRIVPDDDGSVEEIADLLARYRPHLTALCRRLDVATARTLAEINEPRARFVIEPTSRR